MKAIGTLFIAILLIFSAFRAGNTLLIHDNAQVIVAKQTCSVVDGHEKNGLCVVKADLSHTFLSGNPVLLLQNGSVVELPSSEVLMSSYQKSHYGFFSKN